MYCLMIKYPTKLRGRLTNDALEVGVFHANTVIIPKLMLYTVQDKPSLLPVLEKRATFPQGALMSAIFCHIGGELLIVLVGCGLQGGDT